MIEWLNLPEERRREIIVAAANRRGMSEEAVEKDWWVTLVLKAVFSTEWAGELVFKGGTSLSKGWDLIERFSEDIDLSINRSVLGFNEEFVSNTQVSKLRKKASEFICGKFQKGLQTALQSLGVDSALFELTIQESDLSDRDPQVLELAYTSVISRGAYIRDKVIIEVGARSLREPLSQRPIQSIIGTTFPGQEWSGDPFDIPIVEPKRTFLEKAFLLHEGFLGDEAFEPQRKSRHLYDLERLMVTEHAEAALQDKELYDHIIVHRQHFTPIRGLSYEQHQPSLIQFVPPEEVRPIWEEDYRRMRESMIYGSPPDFVQLMLRLEELQIRFRFMDAWHQFQDVKQRALNEFPKDQLPEGDGSSISSSVQFLTDPYKPLGQANDTVSYHLVFLRHNNAWFCTGVEIHRPAK